MKKSFFIILVLLQILICCFGFVGCKKNNFKLVQTITITIDGTEKKFSSSTKGDVVFKDNYKYITKEEFNNAPSNRKYYNDEFNNAVNSKVSINNAIKSAKYSTSYEIVENELKGYYYWAYWYTSGGNIYYTKREYEKTRFTFVYVYVKNDTTIVVKSGNSEITYTVSSYKITYF